MIPKYRAWDKTRNEMNYKVMVGNCDTDDENWTCPIIWIEEKKEWLHFDDYDSIMQSTGLVDKNGKEIFEGDIIAIEVDDTEAPINAKIFQNSKIGMLMFHVFEDNEDVPMVELLEDNSVAFAVIGNIYENPELLENETRTD